MIVLDTNIISEASRPAPDPHLVAWLSDMPADRLYLTNITVTEFFYGGERFRLKTGSTRYVDVAMRLVEHDYAGRILPWNAADAITMQDAMIATICLQHGATLATRNTKDFEGLDLRLVNPFEGG